MSNLYTADGKRRSSMTHANHTWVCPCGRTLRGNGGKSSHQRACADWAGEALRVAENMLAYWSDAERSGTSYAANRRATYAAERDEMRSRLGLS